MTHDQVMLKWRVSGLDQRIRLLVEAQSKCTDCQGERRVELGRQIMGLRAQRWKLMHTEGARP